MNEVRALARDPFIDFWSHTQARRRRVATERYHSVCNLRGSDIPESQELLQPIL
jgi:hypothetical protein